MKVFLINPSFMDNITFLLKEWHDYKLMWGNHFLTVFNMPDTEHCLVAISINLHFIIYAQLDCKFPEDRNRFYLYPSGTF